MGKRKAILVLQPNYKAYSEVWLERMTEILQENIYSIGAFNTTEKKWRNKIPVFDMGKPVYTLFQRLIFKVSPKLLPDPHKLIEKKICRIIRKHADIVLIHFIGPALYYKKAVFQSKKPVFIHVHGFDVFYDLKNPNNPRQKLYDSNYRNEIIEISSVANFIANSAFTVNKLKEIGITPEKIFLKQFGVPINNHNGFKPDTESLNILFLGRLVDFKGPDIVIRAFELAQSRGLKGKLTIAGDGPLKVTCELLKFHSKYKDSITILGKVDYLEAVELYKWADVYTMHNIVGPLTGQEEAFGVSLIEAMSYGLPIITAKSGAVEETVIDNVNGILVEQFDIDAHSDAFLSLKRDPDLRKRLGSRGKEIAQAKYTLEEEFKQISRILEL